MSAANSKMSEAAAWEAAKSLTRATLAARARSGDKSISAEMSAHNGIEPTVRVARLIWQRGRRTPVINYLTEQLTYSQAERFMAAYEVQP
jgi:hypothetical protein